MMTGLHVAMIMDGNGRWATRRGMPRVAGHRAGVRAVREVVEAAPTLAIGTLTLYAFSADNWKRPAPEVNGLMRLLRVYLAGEAARLAENGVRLSVIGRRDRLSGPLRAAIMAAEQATAAGDRLHLRIAVDYSARDALVEAARRVDAGATREDLARAMGEALGGGGTADVDLLIRTGGEQRLSDFLLWECAYAELLFSEVMWPDFSRAELAAAVADFMGRSRRFGGLEQAAG